MLQICLLDIGTPTAVLQKTIEPPDANAIETARKNLVSISALSEGESQELTPLGFHLSALPMHPSVGKMIIYASILRCIEPILTVAAYMSVKSPFVAPFHKRQAAQIEKEKFACGNSDLLTVVQAFDAWNAVRTAGGRQASRRFCHRHFLSETTLMMMARLRDQYRRELASLGFVDAHEGRTGANNDEDMWSRSAQNQRRADNSRDIAVIKCAICAGLYPNVAQASKIPRRQGGSYTKFTTVEEIVALHPSSVSSSNPPSEAPIRPMDCWFE